MHDLLKVKGSSASGQAVSSPVLQISPMVLQSKGLSVSISGTSIFQDITFDLPPCSILGILGPSGSGKSTLLRCLNRLIELQPKFQVQGTILWNGQNIQNSTIEPEVLRTKIGILFQQPVVFPTSITKNVLFGVMHARQFSGQSAAHLAEKSLREAALWDQVKDRLHAPAQALSIGQQQRLCLARMLATNPEILLMDEPTSALDPKTTSAIEDCILNYSKTRAVILITHNPDQAERLCSKRLNMVLPEVQAERVRGAT